MIEKDGITVYPIIVPTETNLKSFNFYLLEEAGSLTLIDAGLDTDECWEALLGTVHRHGFSLDQLDQIILTHSHPDHAGLVNRLLRHKPLSVYAHPQAIPRLKRDETLLSRRIQFFKSLYPSMDCGEKGEEQIQRLIRRARENERRKITGEVIPLGEQRGDLQVIHTPGHAPDHIVLYDAKRKWLFASDLLIGHLSSHAIIEPDEQGEPMPVLSQLINSLKRCLALEVEIVFSGHGATITNPREMIQSRLKRTEEKLEKLLELIKEGYTTGAQLAQAYYGERYQKQFSTIMSEIIAHLDYLELNNRIEKVLREGVWHYFLSST